MPILTKTTHYGLKQKEKQNLLMERYDKYMWTYSEYITSGQEALLYPGLYILGYLPKPYIETEWE